MQSTGQTSTHELSFVSMQGSAITYAMERRMLRASLTGSPLLPTKGVMDRISSWLCPTEHHKARALEANSRVRAARTMAGATCGISMLVTAPFVGWWFLVLFGVSA